MELTNTGVSEKDSGSQASMSLYEQGETAFTNVVTQYASFDATASARYAMNPISRSTS